MKRILSALLLTTLLLSAVSCSEKQNDGAQTPETAADAGESVTAEAAPEEEEEQPVLRSADLLPASDFGGADYTIIGREYAKLGDLPAIEFSVEELTGDIINDTIYQRNHLVEDNFNVKITAITGSASNLVTTSVAAGDGAYDLAWAHVNDMSSLSLSGNLANYYDMPHIDLTQAWWNQLATESLTLNGKCFLQMNYIPFTGVMLSHVLFFNTLILNQYSLTSPFEYVRNNDWTFDNFASLASAVSEDTDGNSEFTDADVYGLLASHGTAGVAMSVAMGVRPVEIAEDGTISLTLLNDRNQSILEKINGLTGQNCTYLITDYSKENDLAKMFAEGKGLFYSGFMTDAYQFFRDMDANYGLVVFPKYDAGDERYITTVTGGTGLLGIPKVVADQEKTGLVTEALAIESLHDVYPAVYETVINGKLLRDPDSVEMFRLIMDGLEISFARTYKYGDYTDLFANLNASGSNDLASAEAKQTKPAQKHYEKVVSSFFND